VEAQARRQIVAKTLLHLDLQLLQVVVAEHGAHLQTIRMVCLADLAAVAA
jgi:hypothetical protein